MGLFGLFGPKKSAAQKAYEDALEKFPTENVGSPEMEAAINAWEAAEGPQTATWRPISASLSAMTAATPRNWTRPPEESITTGPGRRSPRAATGTCRSGPTGFTTGTICPPSISNGR